MLRALHALRVAPYLLATLAVSPTFAFYYIANGHNDLVPIAIIVIAMAFAGRYMIVAALLAGISAAAKITLIAPAAAGAIVLSPMRKRLLYLGLTVIVATSIAVVFGGKAYERALFIVSHTYAAIPATIDTSAKLFCMVPSH